MASYILFVRDIAFGSDMRFARYKIQSEYNITVSKASNITFAKQKYHAERERSISLTLFTTRIFYDIKPKAFQLYSPMASYILFVRDIAFGSDMRFARFLTI